MNAMSLEPGTQIDRYVVEGVMGEGGMAMVYRVRHATLDTLHALKIPSMLRPSLRERLIREGKAQARLSHPNVVPVTDVLDIDGAPGLLMQLVPGPSLADWLHARRAPADEALALFRGVADGVAHAHSQGIIHRDLKAVNVMLYPRATGVTPMVTDFGLAKAVADGDSGTRTGATMGTPTYMAPEQIRDASRVDRRADLYALGVLLYELFTGRVPHTSNDLIELYDAIQTRRYTDPRSLRPDIPDEVVVAIEALLSPAPGDRPYDVQGIFELLEGKPFVPYSALPKVPRPTELHGAATTLGPDSPGAAHASELASERSTARARSLSTLPSLPPMAEPSVETRPPATSLHTWAFLSATGALLLATPVVLLGLGLGLALFMNRGVVPPSTEQTAPAPPTEPAQPAPAQPSTAAPQPVDAPGDIPAPEPTAEVPAKRAPSPEPVRATEPSPPPRTEAPAATTSVSFLSRPMGATVTLDGNPVGTTPLTDLALPEGSHTVLLELGGQHIERTITVGSRYPTRYSWTASSDSWNALQ